MHHCHRTLNDKPLHFFIRLLNEVLRYTQSPCLTPQGQRREETQQKFPLTHTNLLWKQHEDNQAVHAGGYTLFLSQLMSQLLDDLFFLSALVAGICVKSLEKHHGISTCILSSEICHILLFRYFMAPRHPYSTLRRNKFQKS